MYHQDWIMQQIERIIQFLIYLLAGERPGLSDPAEELDNNNALYKRLRYLLDRDRICQAEDLLFEMADGSDRDALYAAILFYRDVNQRTDEELLACHFSREEILDGLRQICSRYGVSDSLLL